MSYSKLPPRKRSHRTGTQTTKQKCSHQTGTQPAPYPSAGLIPHNIWGKFLYREPTKGEDGNFPFSSTRLYFSPTFPKFADCGYLYKSRQQPQLDPYRNLLDLPCEFFIYIFFFLFTHYQHPHPN